MLLKGPVIEGTSIMVSQFTYRQELGGSLEHKCMILTWPSFTGEIPVQTRLLSVASAALRQSAIRVKNSGRDFETLAAGYNESPRLIRPNSQFRSQARFEGSILISSSIRKNALTFPALLRLPF